MRHAPLLVLAPILLAPLCGKDDGTDSNPLPDGGTTVTGLLNTGLPATGSTTDITTTENLDCVIAWTISEGDAIAIARPDGTEASRIVFGLSGPGASSSARPAFSPDGTRLAVAMDNLPNGAGGDDREAVVTMALDGTGRLEASGTDDYFDTIDDIGWSADGSMVRFTAAYWGEPRAQSGTGNPDYIYDRVTDTQVYTAKVDGSAVTRHSANEPYEALLPRFSPSGSTLVWVEYGSGWDEMVRKDVATGASERFSAADRPFVYPEWNADGTRLYFATYNPTSSEYTIAWVPAMGTTETEIGAGAKVLPSPDGTRLLLAMSDGSTFATEPSGANPVPLPTELRFEAATWGPNDLLYYMVAGELFVYDLSTGSSDLLVSSSADAALPAVSPHCF